MRGLIGQQARGDLGPQQSLDLAPMRRRTRRSHGRPSREFLHPSPLACPSTPPPSRCCDDQLNPPWLPRSECTTVPGSGRRRHVAICRASTTSSERMWSAIDQPTTARRAVLPRRKVIKEAAHRSCKRTLEESVVGQTGAARPRDRIRARHRSSTSTCCGVATQPSSLVPSMSELLEAPDCGDDSSDQSFPGPFTANRTPLPPMTADEARQCRLTVSSALSIRVCGRSAGPSDLLTGRRARGRRCWWSG